MSGLYGGAASVVNAYAGSRLVKSLYVGPTRVWPIEASYGEGFDQFVSGGWPNFVMYQNGSEARTDNGAAGIGNARNSVTVGGYFNKPPLHSNSHYCDVLLADAVDGTTSNSHQPMNIILRRSLTRDVDVRFGWAPDGVMYIDSMHSGGGGYTRRANADHGASKWDPGDTLRCITLDNGHNAVYKINADPSMATPLIQWWDTPGDGTLKYDAAHRYMAMEQACVVQVGVNYVPHSAGSIVFADVWQG